MPRELVDWSAMRGAIEREWAKLQTEHSELRSWTLELSADAATWNPLGCCYFQTSVIVLYRSRPVRDHLAMGVTIDTLRHEAAHALRGVPGHDARWRQLAKQLGANASARFDGIDLE